MIGGGDRLELGRRAPIGDRTSGALVGADGTIDWWAPSALDAPAAFFGLLHASGGACRLGPDGPVVAGVQEWAGSSPVVRTVLRATESIVGIDDALIQGTIVRHLTVLRGPVDIVLDVVPGSGFGRPRRIDRFADGIGFDGIVVRGLPEGTAVRLDSGEQRVVTIALERQQRATVEGDGRRRTLTPDQAVERFAAVDREWSALLEQGYEGPHGLVVRDALRQLLLLSSPTHGAPARSFTTSLPPAIGNDRGTDGRLAWLGDAARMVSLLERLERRDLADPVRGWVAAALDSDPLLSVRTLTGATPREERDLDLDGWRGHRPVRTGWPDTAAAWWLAGIAEASLVLDARRHRAALRRVTEWLTEHAAEPDAGRWSSTAKPRRHVDGALAARAALRAAARTLRSGDPLSMVAAEADAAARSLDSWLGANGCFGTGDTRGWRRSADDDSSDAALLRWIVPADGELPALPGDTEGEAGRRADAALHQTLAQLDDGGLAHRHLPHVDDGFPPGQGADTAASAELVAALAGAGRWDQAHERFETLLRTLGPMHLAPSHLDPRSGAHRGNRPDAPALMAVVEAALALRSGPR